jgi:hypothetical protein
MDTIFYNFYVEHLTRVHPLSLFAFVASFPSINRAIDAIRKKKIRDNAVLGGVIAFCICFALWWLFSP